MPRHSLGELSTFLGTMQVPRRSRQVTIVPGKALCGIWPANVAAVADIAEGVSHQMHLTVAWRIGARQLRQ